LQEHSSTVRQEVFSEAWGLLRSWRLDLWDSVIL